MAAATTDRASAIREGIILPKVPMAANVNVPTGTVAAVSSSGLAGPSSNATYNRIIGFVSVGADNTGGSASAKTIEVTRGRALKFENSGSAAVTASHIGQTAKWEDNQTVCAPATADLPAGGTIIELESDGVWIFFP